MALDPGSRLGSYEILSPLGAGGMGEVYRARDARLEREVAVKVLPEHLSGDPGARIRFEREAKHVAALSHPNILAIHDFGQEGDIAYAVMELLEGETLRQRLETVQLSSRKATDIALQIAHGLAAAHDRGVVHRDLKPENVFLTHDGLVKILDFGLAKDVGPLPAEVDDTASPTVSPHTAPGTVMGTVGYMSPEQVRGQEADHRSDIFSFGSVLYEMVAGRRAFTGGSTADMMSAILKEDPPDLSGSGSSIPPVLGRIVRRCLEKAPAERFQSARDLAFALETTSDIKDGSQPTAVAAGVDDASAPPSIAVLPFTNMSADPEQEYFCEGMAEEILSALTKLEGLRVASRSSAFQFTERGRDIRRVGETLNVKTILEGSVRTAGKRLRVTAQLVNVDDGYHLWSERYDRQMEDVFAIQDEISEAIVGALRVKLVGGAPAAPDRRQPADLEAYHLYLKGQHNWYRREKDSLVKAAGFFEEAAEKDPSYVLAHVGVANAYSSLAFYGLQPAVAAAKGRAAIEKALAVDDSLAEVRAGLGLIHLWLDWDWAGAEAEFEKAIALQPENVLPRCWYSFLLSSLGRHEESQAMCSRALELDPISPYVNTSLGLSRVLAGRAEEAASVLHKAHEMDADFLYTFWVLGGAYARSSRPDEAVSVLERAVAISGRSAFYLTALTWALGCAGRRSDAEALIEELRQRAREDYVSPMFFAWAFSGLGESDSAFEWLEKAYEEHGSLMAHLGFWTLDNMRSDPRFVALLDRMKLPRPRP